MDSLRQKLIGLINATKRKKPYRCEVEYLESTGKQYIDTGYNIISSTDEVSCYFQLITSDKYFWLMGEHDNGARFGIGSGDGTNLRNIAYGASTYKVNDTEVYNSQHYFNSNSNGVYVNGTLVHAYENFTSTSTVYLFNLNISGGGNAASGKIWRFTHKRNGKVIRDFIPVLDWNDKPAMYDKVSGELFYNQGTDVDFSYGREIHRVEYIESTGTQYINTKVKLNSNSSVELDYQLTQASQTRKGLFGNLTSGMSARFGSLLSPSNQYLEHGYGAANVYWQQGMPDTDRHVLKQVKNVVYFDGTLINTFDNATFSITDDAPLGNFNYTNYTPALAKYYRSKWWDNDTLVRDYIPAIDENGVGFMFDRVTHSCFLNAGTGDFKYSPKELYYIGSTGTQYINTNFYPNEKTKIEIVGSVLPDNPPACFCATRWSQSPTYDTYGAYYNFAQNEKRFVCYYGRYSDEQYDQVPNTQFNFLQGFFKYTQDKNVLTLEGIDFDGYYTKTFTNTAFQATTYPLWLFRFNAGSSTFNTKGVKIRTAKIWDDGTLIKDYVAAYKDGVLGMYDRVNNVFYQNAGTGTFIVGKIKEK